MFVLLNGVGDECRRQMNPAAAIVHRVATAYWFAASHAAASASTAALSKSLAASM